MITIRDKVRFVETDMMGVVHHANYLRWFEMGRVAYLRACGITLGELMDAGVVLPITEVKSQYKNSCTFDDDFEVQVKMTAFNKAKMEFNYKIIRLRDGAGSLPFKKLILYLLKLFAHTDTRITNLNTIHCRIRMVRC